MSCYFRLNFILFLLTGFCFFTVNSTNGITPTDDLNDPQMKRYMHDRGLKKRNEISENQARISQLVFNGAYEPPVPPNVAFAQLNSPYFTDPHQHLANQNVNFGRASSDLEQPLPHYHDYIKEVPFLTMKIWQKYLAATFKTYVHEVPEDTIYVKEVYDEIEKLIDFTANIQDKGMKEALKDFFKVALFVYPSIPDTTGFQEFNTDVLRLADENDIVYQPLLVNNINIINGNVKFPEGHQHITIYCKPINIVANAYNSVIPTPMILKFLKLVDIKLDQIEHPLHIAKKGYICNDEYNDVPLFKTFEIIKTIAHFNNPISHLQYSDTFVYYQTYHALHRTILTDLARIKIWIKDA